jgi:hypothetical protein
MRSTLAGTPADIKAAFTAKFGDKWEALFDGAHKHHTAMNKYHADKHASHLSTIEGLMRLRREYQYVVPKLSNL